ncbi:MAG: DUF1501 domain-containing protein [Gemmataceae bacterium]
MFTIFTDGCTRTCEGVSRREMLKIGALGGLSLPGLLAQKAGAADSETPSAFKDKSVVVLFLAGGATHIETFDPKMTAPAEYRSMTGEVKTSLPGVTFGGNFENLAKHAHKMAIVRSFRHGNGSHAPATELVMSGGNSTKGMLGSVYASVAGVTNPRSGMPNNALIEPAAAGDKFKGLASYKARVANPGTFGPTYAPFDPSAGGTIMSNMQLKVSRELLDTRRNLLRNLDQLRRDVLDVDGHDKLQQQAFDVILGGVADAFNLEKENPQVLRKYDTADIRIPPAVLKKKRNTTPNFQPIALGRQMLMARRLCEAGCGFVTVTSAGWDMHGNAFGIDDGMPVLGAAVDRAVSAFLEDVEQRGLSDKILLVITGEFGRTPKINNKAGRDHWGNLCTLALAGGGLKMGQVIGASDDKAGVPARDPVGAENLLGTILHTLFDAGQLRLDPGAAKVNDMLAANEPIHQLF